MTIEGFKNHSFDAEASKDVLTAIAAGPTTSDVGHAERRRSAAVTKALKALLTGRTLDVHALTSDGSVAETMTPEDACCELFDDKRKALALSMESKKGDVVTTIIAGATWSEKGLVIRSATLKRDSMDYLLHDEEEPPTPEQMAAWERATVHAVVPPTSEGRTDREKRDDWTTVYAGVMIAAVDARNVEALGVAGMPFAMQPTRNDLECAELMRTPPRTATAKLLRTHPAGATIVTTVKRDGGTSDGPTREGVHAMRYARLTGEEGRPAPITFDPARAAYDLTDAAALKGLRSMVDAARGEAVATGRRATKAASIDEMIDAMPGRVKDRDGREIVPVVVTRKDLSESHGRGASTGATYGDALNFFSDAVVQPVYADRKPTGEVRTAMAGVAELEAGFGRGTHRRLWLDRERIKDVVHLPGAPNGRLRDADTDGARLLSVLTTVNSTRIAEMAATGKAPKKERPVEGRSAVGR